MSGKGLDQWEIKRVDVIGRRWTLIYTCCSLAGRRYGQEKNDRKYKNFILKKQRPVTPIIGSGTGGGGQLSYDTHMGVVFRDVTVHSASSPNVIFDSPTQDGSALWKKWSHVGHLYLCRHAG